VIPADNLPMLQAQLRKWEMMQNPQMADNVRRTIQSIQDRRTVMTTDGQMVPLPGSQETAATGKYKEAMGEAAGKDEGEIQGKMDTRATIDQRLVRMQQIMQTFTPEKFAEEKANITAGLVSLFGIDSVSANAMNQAQSYQEYTKDAMNNVMDAAKAQGGRLLASEIETLKRATASANMTPGAAAAIIAQMRGLLKWQDDHDSAFLDWRDTHGAENPAKFDREWLNRKTHPENRPGAYVDKARKNFPYEGDLDNQTPETLEDGRAYMTTDKQTGEKVPLRWNAQKQRFFPYTPEE
jgi:hypothetical protein